MPKSMVVAPEQVRREGWLETASIPLNQYRPDAAAERERWGAAALRGVYTDMVTIRAFESMLSDIKTQGSFRGIEYEHPGAAHLSIGQEAAVVGLCLPLDPEDLIFGSHRSHGEILAKCLQAIRSLPEAELQRTMEGYLDGDVLRVIEPAAQWDSVQELARHFILYGVLAEIFARTTGLNRGLGGSMHAFFAPFGSMPNNAIVGGSAPIAAGAALFKRCNRRPGIVVANIGDAAAGCGPTWEAITFAAMEQYRTLWDAKTWAARRRCCSTFSTTSTAWAARPWARPWASRCWRASAPASTRRGCTPSGWTATTRWRWPRRWPPSARSWRRAAARCCSTPSPTGWPATLPRTPPPTGPAKRYRSGRRSTAWPATAATWRRTSWPQRPSWSGSRSAPPTAWSWCAAWRCRWSIPPGPTARRA